METPLPTHPAPGSVPAPRRVATVLLVLLLAFTSTGAAWGRHIERHTHSKADLHRLDEYARQRMAATGTPGLAYAVVAPEGIVHERAWGHDGNGSPVTRDTPFLWGSVAKPVTAAAVLTLVEDGRVELDAPVRRYLPGHRLPGDTETTGTTVRQLLTQTSGIPGSATTRVGDVYGPESADFAPRLGALSEISGSEAGGEHVYTSANFLVLGALVEAITGRSFGDYLHGAVLEPAGMAGAIHDAASARQRGLPPGHQRLWGRPTAVASGFDTAGVSYGYLGGDLTDLSAFARLQLTRGGAEGGRVLTAESLQRAHKGSAPVGTGGQSYGLGWRDGFPGAGTRMVWHGGATPGYATMLFVLPEVERAVVVQQNLYNPLQDARIQQVGIGLAHMVGGDDPPGGDTRPADTAYGALIAIVSAATAALVAGVLGSTARLHRPYRRKVRSRRSAAATTAPWTLIAAVPLAASGYLLSGFGGIRQAMNWLPDATAAALGGGAVALAAVGIVRAARSRAATT